MHEFDPECRLLQKSLIMHELGVPILEFAKSTKCHEHFLQFCIFAKFCHQPWCYMQKTIAKMATYVNLHAYWKCIQHHVYDYIHFLCWSKHHVVVVAHWKYFLNCSILSFWKCNGRFAALNSYWKCSCMCQKYYQIENYFNIITQPFNVNMEVSLEYCLDSFMMIYMKS